MVNQIPVAILKSKVNPKHHAMICKKMHVIAQPGNKYAINANITIIKAKTLLNT